MKIYDTRSLFFLAVLTAGLVLLSSCDSAHERPEEQATFEIRSFVEGDTVEGDTSRVSFTTNRVTKGRQYAEDLTVTFQSTARAVGAAARFRLYRDGDLLATFEARPETPGEAPKKRAYLGQLRPSLLFNTLQRQIATKMIEGAEGAGVDLLASRIAIPERTVPQKEDLIAWTITFECNVPLASPPYCTAELYKDGAKVDEWTTGRYACDGTVCATP